MRFFVLISAFFVFTFSANAQNDADAEAVLQKVSEVYSQIESGQGKFTMIIENLEAGVNENQTGFFFIKDDMYRIESDMLDRVTNGETVWTYFKDDEELQITDFDPEEEEINPAEIFNLYTKDYSYPEYKDTTIDSFEFHVIDLYPNDEQESYAKVSLIINKVSHFIVKAVVESKNGSFVTYQIDSFKPNTLSNNDLFNVTAADYGSDVDVIDLR